MRKNLSNEVNIHQFSKQVILLIAICWLLGLYAYRHYFSVGKHSRIQTEAVPSVVIDIKGDGVNAGSYFFNHVPTVIEALTLSGAVKDGCEVIYPAEDVAVSTGTSLLVTKTYEGIKIDFSPMAAEKKILFGIPLNLDTAKAEDLMKIPGIGIKLSQEIVTYRNKHGSFSKIEELKKVKGIGEKKLRLIKKYVALMGAAP